MFYVRRKILLDTIQMNQQRINATRYNAYKLRQQSIQEITRFTSPVIVPGVVTHESRMPLHFFSQDQQMPLPKSGMDKITTRGLRTVPLVNLCSQACYRYYFFSKYVKHLLGVFFVYFFVGQILCNIENKRKNKDRNNIYLILFNITNINSWMF